MVIIVILWGLISWATVELTVFVPVYILAMLLLPALFKWSPIVLGESRVNMGQTIEVFKWGWAQALFGNWEDGLSPVWWTTQCGEIRPTWNTRWTWFLRNPVDNMKWWPIISTIPNPSRVRFIGTPCIPPDGVPGCFLCWQGGYVGFRWQCATWGIWAGWATSPSDSLGIPKDWRAYGFGPVLMILRF